MNSLKLILFCLLFFISFSSFSKVANTIPNKKPNTIPNIVVSIKPLHSLVANVMQGVAIPYLLLKNNTTPHSFSLKPSAARALQKADGIFISGLNLEVFLRKALKSLVSKDKVIELSKTPGLHLLTFRENKKWHVEDEHHHKETHGKPLNSQIDPHIWLDPLNAIIITDEIAKRLSQIDPEHAADYEKNAQLSKIKLHNLHLKLQQQLSQINKQAYMVFHDSYQYLENRYQLNALGSIVFNTQRTLSAKRLRQIQKGLKDNNIICVFSEPQFSSKMVKTAIRGTSVRLGELDPLGTNLEPGAVLYFKLMQQMSTSLRECLTTQS